MQTILYIEDNYPNYKLMQRIVDLIPGVALHCEHSGSYAVERFEELQPALVLLDINLPDISGIEVAAQLRALPSCESVPIVAISANAVLQDIQANTAHGYFNDYVTKPYDIVEVSELIRRYLKLD